MAKREKDEELRVSNAISSAEELEALRKSSYNFCRRKLGLSPKKAREWADSAIESIRQTELEFSETFMES